MKKTLRTKAQLIAGLLLLLLAAHLPLAYTVFYHGLTGVPAASDGAVSLSGVAAGDTAVLDGEWEFYWNRLPDEGAPDFLIGVPGCWSDYRLGGEYLPADGYASYRLTLSGLAPSGPVALYLPNFGGAYRIYVDGTLASESGEMADEPQEARSVPRSSIYPVTLDGGAHTVVIEVSSARFSGLYMAPVLADYAAAAQGQSVRYAARFTLFGIILSSFFVLTAVYILSVRRGVRSLWLPAMLLCVLLRLMLTTEFYAFWQDTLFGGLSYEAVNPLMFLSTFALKFFLIFLIQEQFGAAFSRREKTCFFLYYAALYLLYLFVPQGFYNRHLTVALPAASFALEIYSFFKLYFGKIHPKKYGAAVYWGTILALTGLIVDCYYLNGNIYPDLSLAFPTALAVYLVIVSLVFVLRAARVYQELVLSDARLEAARGQIAAQTEYYDALSARMEETRAARHDLRHFVGAMRRLSGEGRYAELAVFLDEYSEQTATEPLPVFCQNAVANSVLGYYALKARAAGVPLRCACSIPKTLSVCDSDLCVVLGNALENALEASVRMDAPEARFIAVEARSLGGQLLIKIENACLGDAQEKNGAFLSSKSGGAHGMGLRNMKRITERHGGFLKTGCDGRVFTVMAAFPNPDGTA